MAIVVYLETENGNFKKSALEVSSYGRKLADQTKTNLHGIAFNSSDPHKIQKYGVEKLINIKTDHVFDARIYSDLLCKNFKELEGTIFITGSSADSRYIFPIVSIYLDAGYATNVIEFPTTISPLVLKRSAFTNKGFVFTELTTNNKIIGILNNSFGIFESERKLEVKDYIPKSLESNVRVESITEDEEKISIADAEIVVSGGRGLKGPENWSLLEDLAKTLGAATACSKPVSDMGWRPHSEHVGQTGKPVASNLYIAIGVSGAIQHLAGINASKCKVVINNDPEAPFFKAADYGVVGDAFEVVPKLIDGLKKFKSR
ncbi:MAG: electron transfer flavoprotein subunit alpha/FixB family protein [Flavobacteriaceae bacterium]